MSDTPNGEVDQSNGRTDRCAVCGDRVVSVVDALRHSLKQHPRSDRLHETVSGVNVRTNCSECGVPFSTAVSVGINAKADKATLTVSSYCDDCVDADPLSAIMVRDIAPADVLDREVHEDE